MGIPVEMLHRLLVCDTETGKLFWRARTPDLFATARACSTWNAQRAGREAFTSDDGAGYRQGSILGSLHRAHRVIWAMQTGAWPDLEIDHIDGNRANNRITNLRAATRAENCRNVSSAQGSSSKYLGVFRTPDGRPWGAAIKVSGRKIHLGRFSDEVAAALAYDEAAKAHFGTFARLNLPEVAA